MKKKTKAKKAKKPSENDRLYSWRVVAMAFVDWTRVEEDRRARVGFHCVFPFYEGAPGHGFDRKQTIEWLRQWTEHTADTMPRFPSSHPTSPNMWQCGNTYWIGTQLLESTAEVVGIALRRRLDATPAATLWRDLIGECGIRRLLPSKDTFALISRVQVLVDLLTWHAPTSEAGRRTADLLVRFRMLGPEWSNAKHAAVASELGVTERHWRRVRNERRE